MTSRSGCDGLLCETSFIADVLNKWNNQTLGMQHILLATQTVSVFIAYFCSERMFQAQNS